jgi:glycosyltransferase involved in cell wall biosynthesis
MKIAVLSDWEHHGGANIAAGRLAEGFASAGHQVTRIFHQASAHATCDTRLIHSKFATHDMSLPVRAAWKLVPRRLHQRIHERSSEAQLAEILQSVQPDVINVHNLHIGRWSPEMIRVAAAYAPTVCKLCDTWTLTGRCYNPGPCEKYLTRCDETCPTPDEYPALEPKLIGPAFDLRRSIFEDCTNVAAIAPSRWIQHMARAGVWKHRAVYHVRNGLDLTLYKPVDRAAARRALGLNLHGPVLLCNRGGVNERKKGLHLFLEALESLSRRVDVLLIGSAGSIPALKNVTIHELGYVGDDNAKVQVFNSADVYVHPSLADNSPNAVIESLACGTPVVAFGIDGVPEMIAAGTTGWLAQETSSASLSSALETAIQSICSGQDLRTSCRRFVENRYDMRSIVAQYERVFEQMLTGRPEPHDVEIEPQLAACQ